MATLKLLAASGYGLAVLAAVTMSFKSILVKLALERGADPAVLVWLRMLVATPLLLALLVVREGRRGLRPSFGLGALASATGVFGIALPMLFSFYSIDRIGAALSTLITFAYPAITVLLTVALGRGRITRRTIGALGLSTIGLVAVIPFSGIGTIKVDPMGVVLALLAALSWAGYGVSTELLLGRLSPIRLLTYGSVAATVVLSCLFGGRPLPLDPMIWVYASVLGTLSGFVPFVLTSYAIERVGAARTYLVSTFGPAFTATWAVFLLGEHLTLTQIGGMLLLLAGVAAQGTGRRVARRAPGERLPSGGPGEGGDYPRVPAGAGGADLLLAKPNTTSVRVMDMSQ